MKISSRLLCFVFSVIVQKYNNKINLKYHTILLSNLGGFRPLCAWTRENCLKSCRPSSPQPCSTSRIVCAKLFSRNGTNMAYQSAIISCDHISNSNSSLLYFISVAGAVLLKRLWLRNTGNTKIKI